MVSVIGLSSTLIITETNAWADARRSRALHAQIFLNTNTQNSPLDTRQRLDKNKADSIQTAHKRQNKAETNTGAHVPSQL